jgi:Carboxypeptidase regulatory-like domain
MLKRSLAVVQMALFFSALAWTQTFRGGVSGTVVDQSGATVANASVKLTGTDTGLTRTAQTTSAGEFTFQDLPLGKYSVTITQAGFQTQEIKDINVEAGKIFNLQAKLSVASQATAVEVSANTVAIETSSSAVTSVIPTKAILDVPLNGRDFTQLLKLNPGVNANGSVNGTRINAINWQIDGADNNDQWHNQQAVNQGGVSGVAGTLLPIDAIDEFSLQTNSGAEQGRNSGGTLNLVIKSGTNDFHGSLYYFNRNEFLAARNWFTPSTSPVQELRNNQEGGSLGGPIWHNKTFFFLTYEQQVYLAGNTAQGTTPSAAWVSLGEQVLAKDGVPVNPVALNLIHTLWPANSLTGPATQDNFFSTANNTSNSYNGIVKIDHIFNEKNNIAVRYFGGTGSQTEAVGSAIPYYYQTAPSRMHNFSVVYNGVISPSFVSQTVAGVNYFKQVFNDATTGFNIPALGLNTGVTDPTLLGSPDIKIQGFDEIGLTPPLGRIDTTGHLDETLTYTHGTHQFRFGGEYRRSRFDVFYDRNKRGTFTFDGSQGPLSTLDPSDTWNTAALVGTANASLNSLADFLAGRVNTNQATITYGDLQRNYYLNGTSAFFSDSWKVRPNLTLNYGVNWLYQSPLSDPTDRISTFIPADGGITYVNQIGTLWPRDWKNFAPRFGFAYQPKFSSKLVIRGGYGIFYQVPNVNYFGDNKTPNHGATGILANPGGISPVYTLSNPVPLQIESGVPVFGSSTFPTGPFGAFSVSQHFITGYSQNTNLNIQYQLNKSSVLEVGYIGTLSRHLPVTADINQIPQGAPEVDASRPYYNPFNLAAINEIQSVGNGYYNSLIASLRTANFHGFTMKLNYTYGHSRDDLSATRNLIPQNSYNLKGDWGNSDYDIRHSFVTFLTYSAPTPGHLKILLGGWQFNSLLTFYTGTPFTVLTGTDTSLTEENNDRAEIVSNPFQNVPPDVKGSYAYWFNPAAFALPTLGTYSNQSRNSLHGPPTYQVDFSVFKNTKITERLNLQLRVEIFNLFNTRDLALLPNNVVTGSGLGQVTQTLDLYNGAPGIGTGAPRNVQLAAKLVF